MAKPSKDANSVRKLLDFILPWYEKGSAAWILASRVERVLALHARGEAGCCIYCEQDGHVVPWPCPTVRALEGLLK